MLNMHERVYNALNASTTKGLPVYPSKLKIPGVKWAITTKKSAKKRGVLQGNFLLAYAKTHSSFAIDCGDNMYYIILDDYLTAEVRAFHIAHEIGHIVCEHTSLNGVLGKSNSSEIENRQEQEANDFALLLLAPPCVLADEGIYDHENIMKVTGLSEEHAKQAVGEIQHYKHTKKTETEKELCKKFNTKRYRMSTLGKKIAAVSGIALAASLYFATPTFVDRLDKFYDSVYLDNPTQPQISAALYSDTPSQEPTYLPMLTSEPTAAPTPIPTASPTPETTAQPTANATNELTLISITTPIGRNSYATVEIKGLPNTDYQISVHYPSGKSKAAGLEQKQSDSNGYVSWTWKIGGNTTKATHYLIITGGGAEIRVEFEVE